MSEQVKHYDVVIVGAGISGMYALQKMRELGLSAHIIEARNGVGGTWYANAYPGCRFDSETVSYQYSFSKELINEWDWSEEFAAQPETKAYLQYAAKKFEWEKDTTFNTRVESAKWDEADEKWVVTTDKGEVYKATYFLPCIGVLSTPVMPSYAGIDSFKGQSLHTLDWTPEFSEFIKGKRVAIVGTGATAIQIIPKIAPEVGQLTVFQRTANWTNRLRNSKISPEKLAYYRENIDEIFEMCNNTNTGFAHGSDERAVLDMSDEEREAFFDELSAKPGFALWLRNGWDTFVDKDANRYLTDYASGLIAERVKDLDPETREALMPTDHVFGAKRVPMETDYYEAYARDNVKLHDAKKDPIVAITEKGVKTAAGEQEFDAIIYATGFDAITGAFTRFDIVGTDGRTLKQCWENGPRSYLGLATHNFPNMLMTLGPLSGGLLCNLPRCIEENTESIVDAISYARQNGISRIEPSIQAEDDWIENVNEAAKGMIMAEVPSWFNGGNIPGQKTYTRIFLGGRPAFREFVAKEADSGYAKLMADAAVSKADSSLEAAKA